MLRVLLVPSSDYIGHPFPQRHNQIFERLNDDNNFEVHVTRFRLFDTENIGSNVFIHTLNGRRVRSLASYYLVNALDHAVQIRRLIRSENIDILILSNFAAPVAYSLMERLSDSKIPFILDLPDYYPTSAAGYMVKTDTIAGSFLTGSLCMLLKLLIKRASLVTAASNALVHYSELNGAKKAVRVPNGIGKHFFNLYNGQLLRNELGFGREAFVIGYIGSMEFWLDLEPLLQAIEILRKKSVNAHLLLIGGGLYNDSSAKILRIIRTLGIHDYVKQLDFVPYAEVPNYISAFDVGVIPFDTSNPTAYYAAPNKLWEYLSQKKPVIATRIPDISENADCVLTAKNSPDYVNCFLKIAQNKPEIKQKIEVGYNRALSMTWENSARLFGDCINSLVKRH